MREASNGTDIFGTFLLWPGGHGLNDTQTDMLFWPMMKFGTFNLGVQFKQKVDCHGELVVRNCTLRPATGIYPVLVDGNTSTISLAPGTNIQDDKLVKIAEAEEIHAAVTVPSSFNASTYAGFYKALSDNYDSVMHMSAGDGYDIISTDALSNRLVNVAYDAQGNLSCKLTFRDPTDDIIANMRDLMFRTAVASADTTKPENIHSVPAQ